MAGAIPGPTIQTDLLRVMNTEDVAYIVDGFLIKSKADSGHMPPTDRCEGVSPFEES